MFWGIALVVATLPIIMMFVYFFYDLWFASRTRMTILRLSKAHRGAKIPASAGQCAREFIS